MVDQNVIDMIKDVVMLKVENEESFTAFDITMYAKKYEGLKERHSEVKHIVHEMFDEGIMDENSDIIYERTLIDIPGVSEQAYLYHPRDEDVENYVPMIRHNTFKQVDSNDDDNDDDDDIYSNW